MYDVPLGAARAHMPIPRYLRMVAVTDVGGMSECCDMILRTSTNNHEADWMDRLQRSTRGLGKR